MGYSNSSSKYQNNKSVAKNPTISIDVDDPRVSWENLKQTQSRIGSEIEIIGSEGRQVLFGGSFSPVTNDKNIIEEKVVQVPGVPPKGIPPLPVSNLVGSWGANDSIVLDFDFDTTDDANFYIDRFLVKVYSSATEKWYELKSGFGYAGSTFLNTSSISQELTLSASDIYMSIDVNTIISSITKVAVATADILTIGEYVEADMPAYVSPLPQPVFTLSKGVDYYVVTLDPANIALALTEGFFGVIVEEQITTELIKANVSLTSGWTQATGITSNSTIVIYAPDGLHRWVRLKYVNTNGNNSIYSDIADITPDPFQPTNTNPPTQFTAASIAWLGNDIIVSFTQPTTNAGTTIKVKLVPYINGIESTSLYAHFYHLIVPLETSFKIQSLDMYGQFGAYYSQFKAYITSVSAQGIESTGSIISAGPVQRVNTLSGIYPTLGTPNVNTPTGVFRVTPAANGYIVDFDLPAGATRLEVYEKSTAWTTIPVNDDNVVYSGLSPASIPTPDTNTRYVIVRYYDQYDNYSYYSMQKVGQTSGVEVTPIDVGLESLIQFPIKIATDGSIFSGAGDHTVYPQVFFNSAGLFAYDAGGDWTTQIINNATLNSPTFFTKRAVIGNWTISPDGLQNTLFASGSNNDYTGMSANQTYSFWAGASSSLNSNGLAKFSVKPTGEVVASKITINGDGTNNNLISAGGGVFSVTQAGALTATSAVIKGRLEVDGQSYFDANVNVRNGFLIAGINGPNVGPNVQIDSTGLSARGSGSIGVTTKIYASATDTINVKNALTGQIDPVSGITFWTKKALFGSTEGSGFIISDGKIQSNQIIIDSGQEKIAIRSTSTNSANGIILQASTDSDYSIAIGNLNYFATPRPAGTPEPIFSVTTSGLLTANNAVIRGRIEAATGYIGSATNGWSINDFGIFSYGAGALLTVNDGGAIGVGNSYMSSSSSEFYMYDSDGYDILRVPTTGGRFVLGHLTEGVGRQVEVARSAQIAGDSQGANARNSGGLRNMYTATVNNFLSFPNMYLNDRSANGDVLLLWTP